MNESLAQKTLQFVKISSVLTKRALDERNVLAADKEKAAGVSETLIPEMLSAETIGEHQKEAAQAMLATHAGTAQLLKTAIAKIAQLSSTQKQAGALGEGVDPSVVGDAPTGGLNDNYVGQLTSEKRASDDAMLRVLDAPGR